MVENKILLVFLSPVISVLIRRLAGAVISAKATSEKSISSVFPLFNSNDKSVKSFPVVVFIRENFPPVSVVTPDILPHTVISNRPVLFIVISLLFLICIILAVPGIIL